MHFEFIIHYRSYNSALSELRYCQRPEVSTSCQFIILVKRSILTVQTLWSSIPRELMCNVCWWRHSILFPILLGNWRQNYSLMIALILPYFDHLDSYRTSVTSSLTYRWFRRCHFLWFCDICSIVPLTDVTASLFVPSFSHLPRQAGLNHNAKCPLRKLHLIYWEYYFRCYTVHVVELPNYYTNRCTYINL